MIWSQEIRNDKPLYLTTNKSGWPPGSRHPILKPAALSDRTLPSQQGLGYRDTTYGAGPSPVKGGPTRKLCPRWPGVFRKQLGAQPAHTRFQMVNQLGPPLERFEAR